LFLRLGRDGIAAAGPAGTAPRRIYDGIERPYLQPWRLADCEMVDAVLVAELSRPALTFFRIP
jgi:hypothetical protein